MEDVSRYQANSMESNDSMILLIKYLKIPIKGN